MMFTLQVSPRGVLDAYTVSFPGGACLMFARRFPRRAYLVFTPYVSPVGVLEVYAVGLDAGDSAGATTASFAQPKPLPGVFV